MFFLMQGELEDGVVSVLARMGLVIGLVIIIMGVIQWLV